MNCKELAYMLADYIDGSMDPLLREELDGHLAMCEPCRVFTKTYQAVSDKTRMLRRHIEYEIPPEVCRRLETFIHAVALKYPEKMRSIEPGRAGPAGNRRGSRQVRGLRRSLLGHGAPRGEPLRRLRGVQSISRRCGKPAASGRRPSGGDPVPHDRADAGASPGEEFFLA